MKYFKILSFTVIGLVILVLGIAAISPSQYKITRDINISKPSDDVFNYVKHLKNMDNYSVWAKLDPNMKKSYQGTDGEVGFIASWSSDNEKVGKGEQEITEIVEGKRIETQLRFFEPFEAVDDAYFLTENIGGNQTKLTWGFEGNIPYPFNLMLFFIDMEIELGKPLADSLTNLKNILEK